MISVTRISTLIGHEGPVYALEHSPRQGYFFSGGSDRMVVEWPFDGSEPPKAIVNVGAIIYSIRLLSESNRLLIGTSSGHLHVIDLEQAKEIRHFTPHQQGIFDIQYDHALDRLFTASADGTVLCWRLSDFTVLHSIPAGSGKVRSLALHRIKGWLAAACGDGCIRIIDSRTGLLLHTLPAHSQACLSVVFDPVGERLISGGKDAHLHVWQAGTWQVLQSIPAHNYAIYSMTFSPDGKTMATASRDKTVKWWDAETMAFQLRIDKEKWDGHRNSVNKVLWLKDPEVLVSTGDDRSILTWK